LPKGDFVSHSGDARQAVDPAKRGGSNRDYDRRAVSRPSLSIADKIAANAPLRLSEFLAWAGIGNTFAYELIKEGKLKVTRFGKTNYVTPHNRRAFAALMTGKDDAAPAAAGSSPIAKPALAVTDDRHKRRRGRPEIAERRGRVAGPAARKSADPVDA
jgi:hypothetical protein